MSRGGCFAVITETGGAVRTGEEGSVSVIKLQDIKIEISTSLLKKMGEKKEMEALLTCISQLDRWIDR